MPYTIFNNILASLCEGTIYIYCLFALFSRLLFLEYDLRINLFLEYDLRINLKIDFDLNLYDETRPKKEIIISVMISE